MSIFRMSKREKALARIAPITQKSSTDRRMRVAVLRGRRNAAIARELSHQQAFDQAVADLVRAVPVSDEIAEWFRNEKLIPQQKRRWKRMLRNPVVLTIGIAMAVIAGICVLIVMERMNEFPGSATARKMLTIASSTRRAQLDPVETDAGALGDLFFMKYRLEHYDVPPEFADYRTATARVFDDDEGHRVAQITVPEQRMQFFLFPGERDPKDGKVREFAGWKYVDQEGWAGAVKM
nr:hypothetical protein [Chthoniobacterales bacterium]